MSDQKLNTMILWIVIATLILVLLILTLGMLNGIIDFEFSPVIFDVLGTFGGALAGAALAGYFSVKVFERKVQHEESKLEDEQYIKKIIFLNEYLKESFDVMGYMRYLEDDFRRKISVLQFPTPENHDMQEELRVNNLAFEFFQKESQKLLHDIEALDMDFNSAAFDTIFDIEYRNEIRNHRYILKRIMKMSKQINEKNILANHIEMWEFQDVIVDMKKYIDIFRHFEKNLYDLKKIKSLK